MEIPKGFVDLSAAYNAPAGTFVNIIGIVVDIMVPKATSTGEHTFAFKLLDTKLRDSVYGSQGLTIRFFSRGGVENLPKVRKHGDVVLLRQIKMQPFSGLPVALSNYQTGVLVFPAASIPDPSYSIAYHGTKRLDCSGTPSEIGKLTLLEQHYIILLNHELSATVPQLVSTELDTNSRKRPAPLPEPPGPPGKRHKESTLGNKFMLVEALRHRQFADICVQVVKKFPHQNGMCELYVTDYTTNKAMFCYKPPEAETGMERDGDSFGYSGPPKKSWPGPYGFLVLKVNAQPPHAHFANAKISEGDFVLLRNVKMKIRAEGAKLEGDMWPDDRNPEKVQITKLLNHELPEIRQIASRKKKYWDNRKGKEAAQQANERKTSETNKKRAKKLRQGEQRAAAKAHKTDSEDTGSAGGGAKSTLNQHIRCSNEDVAISTVQKVLDADNTLRHTNVTPDGRTYILPFVNAKYRARVRVIDFEPKKVEDFAVPSFVEEEDHEGDDDDDKSDFSANIEREASAKHEWYFSLLLQNAALPANTANMETIWVHVGHEEAQYLLGNDMDDPRDLRDNVQLLAKLKEKLCVLWGNLEEKQADEALSNRPFECCIAEYGVALDDEDPEKTQVPFGWKRMYRMFGTTIL